MAAIGRKQGATLNELAERHNVAEKTIRNWLDRFAEQQLSEAPYDVDRSGRPPKLSESEQQKLFRQLHQSPNEFGYDREVWFPELAHQHIKESYGVEFSIRHVYRLMDEAGLSYRTARSRHYQADPEKEAAFRDTVQKTHLIDDGWTFIAIGQSSKYVGTVERRGWYPRGSDPRRPVWNSRTKVTTLGAITHDGERMYLSTEEYLTVDHAIQLLGELKREFGKKLIVFLDQAPYFYAKDLWEYVSGDRSTDTVDDTTIKCVEGDDLKIWYLPSHLPELNPVGNCWNQFKDWYKYRLIETLEELKTTLPAAFRSISEPDLLDYICTP